MGKKVAPTIVLVLVIFFIVLQAGIMVYTLTVEKLGLIWRLLISLIPLVIIIVLITVYIERMREIDEEEKDDLSKY
jgi:hypothetical protein